MVNKNQILPKIPLKIYLEITDKCNLNCSFCYKKNITTKNFINHLSQIIENLKQYDFFEIVILGGEPLLEKKLENILKKVRGSHSKSLITLATNGTFAIGRNMLNYIDAIQISLHSATPEVHDKIVNKRGAFNRTQRFIHTLRNWKGKIGINMVICNYNYKDVYNLAAYLVRYNIDIFSISRLIPNDTKNCQPNQSYHINTALADLRKVNEILKINVAITVPIPVCTIKPPLRAFYLSNSVICDAPFSSLVINHTGDVRPCPSLNVQIGNILEENLESIWQESRVLNKWRAFEFIPNNCKTCDYFSVCMGGCRASAYNSTKELKGEDPLLKEVGRCC